MCKEHIASHFTSKEISLDKLIIINYFEMDFPHDKVYIKNNILAGISL